MREGSPKEERIGKSGAPHVYPKKGEGGPIRGRGHVVENGRPSPGLDGGPLHRK